MFVLFFAVEVCDGALTNNGEVRRVCRHPELTDPPAVAVGLVAVVALGAFFTEISGFGISLKRQVEQAQETAKAAAKTAVEAKQATSSLEESTEDLAEGVELALRADLGVPTATPGQREVIGPADSTGAKVGRLAERYNRIRMTMPSSTRRTTLMEEVVRELGDVLRDVDGFDVEAHLHHADRGMRLAAYAYTMAHPDRVDTHDLVDAAFSEDKPFGQYHALRAVERAVQYDPSSLLPSDRQRLEQLLAERDPLGDRASVVRRILDPGRR
jgi:hypothetical protein